MAVAEDGIMRAGRWAGIAIAALGVVYAVAYLVVTPSAQRGSDTERALRSYLDHPTGLRLAALCLFAAGLAGVVAWTALTVRLARTQGGAALVTGALGLVATLATAAHGLGDLLGLDVLAHRYETGDAATRAAVRVQAAMPSAVDPRGLFTFGIAGAAVAVAGFLLGRDGAATRRVGRLGVVTGLDMVALFACTAVGFDLGVLVTGGLASVVLGPTWWVLVVRELGRPAPVPVPVPTAGAVPAGWGTPVGAGAR
jgi:hypothetical protein